MNILGDPPRVFDSSGEMTEQGIWGQRPDLIEPFPLIRIFPFLVRAFNGRSINSAVVTRVDDWLRGGCGHVIGGEVWVEVTHSEFAESLGVTLSKARRAVDQVQDRGVVLSISPGFGWHGPGNYRWYRINYSHPLLNGDPSSPSATPKKKRSKSSPRRVLQPCIVCGVAGATRKNSACSLCQQRASALRKENSLPSDLRMWVFERDDNRCVVPECPDLDLVVDHIIPILHGGKTNPDNLQSMCATHNNIKRARLDWAYNVRPGTAHEGWDQ